MRHTKHRWVSAGGVTGRSPHQRRDLRSASSHLSAEKKCKKKNKPAVTQSSKDDTVSNITPSGTHTHTCACSHTSFGGLEGHWYHSGFPGVWWACQRAPTLPSLSHPPPAAADSEVCVCAGATAGEHMRRWLQPLQGKHRHTWQRMLP